MTTHAIDPKSSTPFLNSTHTSPSASPRDVKFTAFTPAADTLEPASVPSRPASAKALPFLSSVPTIKSADGTTMLPGRELDDHISFLRSQISSETRTARLLGFCGNMVGGYAASAVYSGVMAAIAVGTAPLSTVVALVTLSALTFGAIKLSHDSIQAAEIMAASNHRGDLAELQQVKAYVSQDETTKAEHSALLRRIDGLLLPRNVGNKGRTICGVLAGAALANLVPFTRAMHHPLHTNFRLVLPGMLQTGGTRLGIAIGALGLGEFLAGNWSGFGKIQDVTNAI